MPYLAVFLLAFSALLLEIAYTRIISFKLFYYHTYMVVGLAMLGTGFGGALVATLPRLPALVRLVGPLSAAGACLVAVAYLLVATIPLSVLNFAATAWSGVALLTVCAALFAGFAVYGVLLSAIFADAPQRMGRLYLADLAGAALGCAAAVPAIAIFGAPATVFAAAAVLAFVGVLPSIRLSGRSAAVCSALAVALAFPLLRPDSLPDPVPDPVKTMHPDRLGHEKPLFSAWSPVFRVDVSPRPDGDPDMLMLHHDGLWGSALHRWDRNPDSLAHFDRDERSIPFRTLARRPDHVLIIGAAGGHEILAAIRYQAQKISAVELNPVTVGLVRDRFADYVGRIAERPDVELVNDDGRSWLTRQSGPFDIVYFVAADSYAAMNSATSGAFVLSESYLYTVEMITTTLERLAPDGLLAMQFGEDSFEFHPNRTIRYVATARAALERLGVRDPGSHVAVVTTKSMGDVTTVLVSPSPIGPERARHLAEAAEEIPNTRSRWAGKYADEPGPVGTVLSLDKEAQKAWLADYPFAVDPVYDDAPFFWHFARFSSVLRGERPSGPGVNWESSSAGERVLLATFAVAALFGLASLALPLLAVGPVQAPRSFRRGVALYFATIGLGFMLFEIALVQKLALLLGYPTYSLTVTLLSLLVSAGIGSLASERWRNDLTRMLPRLVAGIAALAVLYTVALDSLTPMLLAWPLTFRVAFALLITAPLGLLLGAFLPLGVAVIVGRVAQPGPLVAWAWATNGFFSVLGSTVTTMLAMSFGFRIVFALAAVTYLFAGWQLRRLASLPPDEPALLRADTV